MIIIKNDRVWNIVGDYTSKLILGAAVEDLKLYRHNSFSRRRRVNMHREGANHLREYRDERPRSLLKMKF